MTDPMRFGLVGTGPWAGDVHGPALAATDGIELGGVWGRSPDKATALAETLGVRPFAEIDALIDAVDAMAFAVPPDVQAELALRAARAGKHLLLDKPVATTGSQARALAEEAEARGITSVVFFTDRFTSESVAWFEELDRTGGWRGGDVQALATLDAPGNPFSDSPWRHERGALWDIGPHALSNLIGALGPVTSATGVPGAGDLVHLVLEHAGGATSTATLTLFAPPAAATQEVRVWGEAGVARMPTDSAGGPVAALSRAAATLVECVRDGTHHPADLRLGVTVVELIEHLEVQLSDQRRP
jgi:predicted dehydrogenase